MFAVVSRVIKSKVEERKVFFWFQPFLAKNNGLTPLDFPQNFKFANTFSIGKRSREMMFAVVFRVIGSKVEAKKLVLQFQPFLAKNHGLTPLDFPQNFKFANTFSIGKRSREMMFAVVSRVIGSKVEERKVFFWFQPFLAKNHGLTPLDFPQNFKSANTFSIGKRSREMMFAVVSRVIGSKVYEKKLPLQFQRFLAKNHGLTPLDFPQNFKFANTFSIGKRGREMMFAVVSRVIGSKVDEKKLPLQFQRFLAKNHGLTPLDFPQNFKFANTFSIGKRSRQMMFAVVSRVIGSKVEERKVFFLFQPFLAKINGLTPLDFPQNFKFANTFSIGKRSRFWPKTID